MTQSKICRRTVIAGLASTAVVTPALAQTEPYAQALGAARDLDQLRSIVIGREGEILAAEAVRGPALERPANIKSVSKTVVAVLTGIAIDRGALSGVDARLGYSAPQLIPAGADPRVADITIADLLTMQAGLERPQAAITADGYQAVIGWPTPCRALSWPSPGHACSTPQEAITSSALS